MNIIKWKNANLQKRILFLHSTGLSQLLYGIFLFSTHLPFASNNNLTKIKKIYKTLIM